MGERPEIGAGIRLAALRGAAFAVLWAERLTVALWMPFAAVMALAALALLGLRLWLVFPAVAVACVGVLLWRGLRGFPAPGVDDADRWLERQSGLAHRPLQALRDAPAEGDAALWRAHQARARAALARLRIGVPRPGLASRDPYALRVAALLMLVAASVVAGGDAARLLARAFLSGVILPSGGAAALVQAWIERPPYTGLPPLFLARGDAPVAVPEGARLTVSVSGSVARPRVFLAGESAPVRRLADGAWQAVMPVRHGGRLRVTRWFGTLARWTISVLPNTPPDIAWDGAPGRAGTTLSTRLPWHVAQRWGVAALAAELRPDGHTDAPLLRVPVPLPGAPRDARGAAVVDLQANPYAGLTVRGVLRGRDVSGQEGASAEAVFALPARVFHDRLAQAVVELRRRLALRPGAPAEAADDLDALAAAPEARAHHAAVYLNLSAVAGLLRARGAEGAAEAEARLWILALDLDGALPDAAERKLAEAREDARRALAEHAHGRISDAELARRMAALREALAQRMADLARKAFERGQLGSFDPRGKSFTAPSIERMMRQVEQDARAGRNEAARREMAELENLLNKLNVAKVLSPEQAQKAAEANRQAQQMMRAAGDLARREGGLMDSAQARAPRPPPLPPRPPFWGQTMPPAPPDAEKLERDEAARGADARTERALERALEALKNGMQSLGAKPSPNLDAAGQAMRRAEQSLRQGQEGAARMAEAEAVQDLQKGGQDMARDMQQNSQMAIVPGAAGQQDETGTGMGLGQDQEGERDPLGRPVRGTNGRAEDDGSVRVPTEMELGRSRAIQEELRRRDAERSRPQPELDYFERLLTPY